ncbi:DHH family protein [Williamsoniiplasma somnilux]|uniref:DHH family protein n=1 Tax=Williamsoniiplasma somnilux TaxID=215578 RepID=A0A2K8NXL8_9MOLU|nr:bifunctional oligoribonuclease/PAP phosphatase NrnA [Williamsoniiplasma somnilux]ATZ18484.1 DHH family protein [Williamsoniiplasma somnilux]
MDKKIEKKLVEKINEYKNIIVAKHILPDWDAQGSAMGMAHIIKENFKGKKIVVVGDRLNDDKDFWIDSKDLTDKFIKSALVITVDTGTSSRIDFEKFSLAKEIFKVDHHIPVDNYGNENLVDVSAIACAQVVTLWAKDMKLKVNRKAATNLYKGLLTDSNRFLFPATNVHTFEAAIELINSGIDLEEIHNYLYVGNLNLRKWTNYAFSKVEISKKGVAIIVIEEKDYKPYKLTYDEVKLALSTMAGIDEIKIWSTVIVWKGVNKVSLRSRKYDVNTVAVKYNGGGHKLASGAELDKISDYKNLVKDLDKLIK